MLKLWYDRCSVIPPIKGRNDKSLLESVELLANKTGSYLNRLS